MDIADNLPNEKRAGLNGNTIKLLMMCLMVLDHIHYFIPGYLAAAFHLATRCVAPFFAFTAVEGFLHTRNRQKYLIRLFVASVVMFSGNWLINSVLIKDPAQNIENNIFLTYFTGVLTLYLLSQLQNPNSRLPKATYIAAVVFVILFSSVFTEGGALLLPLMLVIFYARKKTALRNGILLAISAAIFIMYVATGYIYNLYTFAANSEFMFVLAIPFYHIYNGERGKNSAFAKYVFYVFYPLHLWIITILARLMNLS